MPDTGGVSSISRKTGGHSQVLPVLGHGPAALTRAGFGREKRLLPPLIIAPTTGKWFVGVLTGYGKPGS